MARLKTAVSAGLGSQTAPEGPEDIRDEIKRWLRTEGESQFHVCDKLAEAYETGIFKSWGFEDFSAYCEKELSLAYKSAMNRVNVGKIIHKHNLTVEQFDKVGVSKMKELVSILDEEMSKGEVNKLLKDAEKQSFKQVADFVKKMRVHRSGGETTEITTLKFTVINDSAKVVDGALKLAKESLEGQGIENVTEGQCLELLAVHFVETFSKDAVLTAYKEVHKKEVTTKVGHKAHLKSEHTKKKAKASDKKTKKAKK